MNTQMKLFDDEYTLFQGDPNHEGSIEFFYAQEYIQAERLTPFQFINTFDLQVVRYLINRPLCKGTMIGRVYVNNELIQSFHDNDSPKLTFSTCPKSNVASGRFLEESNYLELVWNKPQNELCNNYLEVDYETPINPRH
jgi:hypothetical protein